MKQKLITINQKIQAQIPLMHKKHSIGMLALLLILAVILGMTVNQPEDIADDSAAIYQDMDASPDFASYTDTNEKKQAFFEYLIPGIRWENERISKERVRLFEIQEALSRNRLSTEDEKYAATLGERYRSSLPDMGVTQEWLSEMLIKVNMLPESLVLTQAANESAWGTSRFAEQGNNYFGQWCYQTGCGIVPLQRSDSDSHEVAVFESAADSIHSYFMNVNRNEAYSSLRDIRANLDEQNEDLLSVETAHALTEGLLKYSERGEDYINDLQVMLRVNNKFWTSESDN